jgi:Zn-dependent protease with chaperone function
MIGVAGLAAILAVSAAILLSLSTAAGLPAAEAVAKRLGLRRRLRLVEALLAAPLIAMLLVPLLCLLPSIASMVVPAWDHCLHHDDHAVHLCFVHVPTVPIAFTGIGVSLFAVMGAIVGASATRHALRSAQLRGRLGRVGETDHDDDPVPLPTDRWVAFTLGIIRPRVYVSTHLLDTLSPAQSAVVMAHERGHQRRRDPLRRLILQAAATLHLPHVRRRLLDAHELAVEQTCDTLAAQSSGGDRLLVAETLISLQRMASPAPAEALGASHTQLEARVLALLETPIDASKPLRWRTAVLAMAGLVAIATPAHHVAEHLIGHWLF